MKATLARGPVTLKFLIQPRASDKFSGEDAMEEWTGAGAPFYEAATIHIPKRDFDTPEMRRQRLARLAGPRAARRRQSPAQSGLRTDQPRQKKGRARRLRKPGGAPESMTTRSVRRNEPAPYASAAKGRELLEGPSVMSGFDRLTIRSVDSGASRVDLVQENDDERRLAPFGRERQSEGFQGRRAPC
jgi:hypothetical protein